MKLGLTLRQRTLLVTLGLTALGVAVLASFAGPAAVLTVGPSPPGAGLEIQLLDMVVLVSAACVGLATWRGPPAATASVIVAGVAGMFAGVYLAFGIWTPVGNGWSYAPFTLQGALVLLWGMFTLSLAAFVAMLTARRSRDVVRIPLPAR